MGIGDYLALLITILFPLAGAYIMVRCWNQVFSRRDQNSVYFQKYNLLLETVISLEVVSFIVIIIWNSSSYYAKNYTTLFVIDMLLWLIVIPCSIHCSKAGKNINSGLLKIPDVPLADDELEYYREAFTGLFEDIRTSNANRKAELEKIIPSEEEKNKSCCQDRWAGNTKSTDQFYAFSIYRC